MKKTLIWEGIQGLSKRDRESFLRFIQSPYFNLREDLVSLAVFLLSDTVLARKNLSKKDVFYAVYSTNLVFSDQKIRLLLSYMQKQLEIFLAIDEFKSSDDQAWFMLSAMHKRDLSKNYNKKIKFFRQKLVKKETVDWQYYLNKYKLELHKLNYSVSASGKKEFAYEVMTDSLDSFYLISKLRHACTALLYQKVFDRKYQFPLLDDILRIASQEKFLKIPAVSIYYHFIKVMNEAEEVDFVRLKNELFLHEDAFSKLEFSEIFTMILNFYIREINRNKIEFYPEALSFYKKGLEIGLLLENGYLPRFKYSNIVAMAIQVGDLEWIGTFIEDYRLLLRKEVRLETYSFNRARLEFVLKRYDASLELLQNINYNDLFLAITARILQIKIYWETSELELLDHHLHSLKFFLKRKKIVGYHYRNWADLISFIRKLANLNPYDKEKVLQFKQEVKQKEVLMEKSWLLEQIVQLL